MGQVYTQTKNVWVDLVPSATAYSAGDCIGTAGGLTTEGGKIPLPHALRFPTYSGVLQSLTMYDNANQRPALTVLLYSQKPSFDCTDNAKPAAITADSSTLLGIISIAAADWVTITDGSASRAIVTKAGIGIQCGMNPTYAASAPSATGEVHLYAVFITSTTPDYVGQADELTACFGFLQD
jgi:hypothetical protein